MENLKNNLYSDYDTNVTFGVIVAVFFPCFACVFSGAHRANELKTPAKSIPYGTFITIILSCLIYVGYMIL